MNMMNEKTLDVYLKLGPSRIPARLYIRFKTDGVGADASLDCEAVPNGVREALPGVDDGSGRGALPVHLLDALVKNILPRMPEGAALELDHIVETLGANDQARFIRMVETIAAGRAGDEPVAVFTLSFEVDGRHCEVTEAEDIYYALREVARGLQGACRICGYCAFAHVPPYGGDDWRHGLFCFRDDPGAYEELKHCADLRTWASRSWSNVDAFHFCPSFRLADWCQRLLATDAPIG